MHAGAFLAGCSECRAIRGSRSSRPSHIFSSQLPVCSKCKATIRELTFEILWIKVF